MLRSCDCATLLPHEQNSMRQTALVQEYMTSAAYYQKCYDMIQIIS
jgi:hypothetical protein